MVGYLLRYCCFLIIYFFNGLYSVLLPFLLIPFSALSFLDLWKTRFKIDSSIGNFTNFVTWCLLPTFRSFTILSEQGGGQSMLTAPWPVVTSLLRALLIWTTSLLKNG